MSLVGQQINRVALDYFLATRSLVIDFAMWIGSYSCFIWDPPQGSYTLWRGKLGIIITLMDHEYGESVLL